MKTKIEESLFQVCLDAYAEKQGKKIITILALPNLSVSIVEDDYLNLTTITMTYHNHKFVRRISTSNIISIGCDESHQSDILINFHEIPNYIVDEFKDKPKSNPIFLLETEILITARQIYRIS